jgi:hypothetical protein
MHRPATRFPPILDFYVFRLGVPSVVKMDIEGTEWLALNGDGETLERSDAQDFLIEFHPEEIQALSPVRWSVPCRT